MPRSKDGTSKYTAKQERKAEHIEEGYEKKGVSKKEAEKRAWATVNKQDGGGKNPGGSGRKTMPAKKKTATAKASSAPAKKKTAAAKTSSAAAKKKTPAKKSSSTKSPPKGILTKAKDALFDAGRAIVPAARTGIAVGAAAAGAFMDEATGKSKARKSKAKTTN